MLPRGGCQQQLPSHGELCLCVTQLCVFLFAACRSSLEDEERFDAEVLLQDLYR
jgi:hypothetical protein